MSGGNKLVQYAAIPGEMSCGATAAQGGELSLQCIQTGQTSADAQQLAIDELVDFATVRLWVGDKIQKLPDGGEGNIQSATVTDKRQALQVLLAIRTIAVAAATRRRQQARLFVVTDGFHLDAGGLRQLTDTQRCAHMTSPINVRLIIHA